MKKLYIALNKKAILTLILLVVSTQIAIAQFANVTGPSPVDGYTAHTYQFTDGFVHLNREWIAVGGTVDSTWYTKFPDTYYASVTWNNGPSGSITFKSNGLTLGSKSVVINPTSSVVTNLSDENYIYTIAPRIATTDVSQLINDEMLENVNYFDGLGRPMQSNSIRGGSDNEDIITHVDYDSFGRQAKEYLPYTVGTNGGAYKSNAESETKTFYDAVSYEDDFIGMTTATINPYSEKEFETSPAGRVLKQAAPGKDWKLGNGNEIEFDFEGNDTLKVRFFKVSLSFANSTYSPTLVSNGYYNPNQLIKTITYDENHTTGKDHSTEEYKDKQGRVVLKKTYNNEVAHDTYYVYDDFGNLTFVIPPKVTIANISTIELNELCYRYKYDTRNRLVEKRIPGKDWEEIVYNKLDLPVMTRDENLKAQSKWLITKYDAYGRVVYTGLKNSGGSRTYFQGLLDSGTTHYESKVSSGTGFKSTYYTSNAYPTWTDEILTVNYYDNYTFNTASGNSESSYGVTPITAVKGLATGSRVKVLGTGDWITTVSYYDSKYRPIFIYTHNAYLNTTDKVKSDLDFMGTVIETTIVHERTGFSSITTVDKFDYDHMNRLVEHKQSINGNAEEVIAKNTYDQLGQLIQKSVGGKTTQSRLQDIDYTYNVRGWLKEINDITNLGNDLFSFKLNYNTKEIGSSNVKLYNGNISETIWKTAYDVSANKTRGYAYKYDDLNRITYADYGVKTSGNYNLWSGYDVEISSYDKNGNIMALWRNDNAGRIDQLTYIYYENGESNRLKSVNDTSGAEGFNNGTSSSTEYTYDANGNMISDTNKGISNISYNHLNLPTSISINGAGKGDITYIYDATGVKLKKIVDVKGQPRISTIYAGNYIYKDGASTEELKFFSHPEGYVEPNHSNFDYTYQYKDHLGNIRLSYQDTNGNYEQLLDSDFDSDFDGWEENGSVNYTLESGRLKANVNSPWEGVRRPLTGLTTVAGEVLNVRVTFDKGNTQSNVRLYLHEKDANGNHVNYNVKSSNLQTGTHTFTHTMANTGNSIVLRIDKDNTNTSTETYFYIDHASVTKNSLEILEENNYYPFGLKHKGYNNVVNGIDHPYGFSGKEENDEMGLNWMDFSARNYSPDLGRWFVIDALADASGQIHNSPYNYGLDNPIVYKDPDGNCPPGVNCIPVSVDSSLQGNGGTSNTAVNRSGSNISVTNQITVGNVTRSSSPIKISLGSNVRQNHVTDQSAVVIAKNLDTSGNGSAKITSAYREPADQARVMFDNIESNGAASQKRLYGNSGDKVVDVYTEAKLSDAISSVVSIVTGSAPEVTSDTEIKDSMTDKINELGPGNVSKHSSDPNTLNVIDISPRSLTNGKSFGKSVKADPNIKKVITPPKDPAYHIEIPQKKQQ